MENVVPLGLYVEDALESYLVCKKHAIDVHFVLGTHKLLELILSEVVATGELDDLPSV